MLMARLGAPFVDQTWPLNSFDKPLLARVFKPRGEGPFPALVECHGGAWCLSDRTTERLRHQAMAANGIVSIALDFRSGNEDPYSRAARPWCECARRRIYPINLGMERRFPYPRDAGQTW